MDAWIRRRKNIAIVLLCLWLTACATSSATSTPLTVPVHQPVVAVIDAPDVVCRAANQLRLVVQTSEEPALDVPGLWVLRSSQGRNIHQGPWQVRDGAVLISFPESKPLPPDQYIVHLLWQEVDLAQHVFLVDSQKPTIADLSLSLTPDGANLSRLPVDLRGFHIGYEFQGGCLGAPYWMTVWDEEGEILCNQSGMLADTEQSGALACYRDDGAYLDAGDYRVEMTLMEETAEALDFVVEAETVVPTPAPSPSPVRERVVCGEFFAAAGITPEGEPFLPLELFDWYTQVVYAGVRCRNLTVGTGWRATWYHDDDLVRESEGHWRGADEGVVWDSLTGVPENPFLSPGAYTVTLAVEDVVMTTAFRVFDYEPVNATDGDVVIE